MQDSTVIFVSKEGLVYNSHYDRIPSESYSVIGMLLIQFVSVVLIKLFYSPCNGTSGLT